MTARAVTRPEWTDELGRRVAAHPQVVVSGATDSMHVGCTAADGRPTLLRTDRYAARVLRDAGFSLVLSWRPVEGVRALLDVGDARDDAGYGPGDAAPDGTDTSPRLAQRVLGEAWRRPDPAVLPGAADLAEVARRVVNHGEDRVALVVTDAGLLPATPGSDDEQHRLHLVTHDLLRRAGRRRSADSGRQLFNCIIWLVRQEQDLPHWLIGAAGMHVVTVPEPVLATRIAAAGVLVPLFPGAAALDDAALSASAVRMAEQAEGMSLAQMHSATLLAVDQQIPAEAAGEAVHLLRAGFRRSPWRDPELRARFRDAVTSLSAGVMGQERAVRKVSEILARSALGLSGAHSTSHPGRPQGVLFLAGPTGVGKTELTKQIARLVAGRADAVTRFDMSEFSAEHTQARLLGSPPGYVGHEAGGELTNAVRNRPFGVLLFDEIEKAHPRILDKFLQILEDGRLTDGAGSTVHFGETLIVFTSNLGTLHTGEDGTVTPIAYETPPEEFDARVLAGIRRTFIEGIQRPELLNRIGEKNVVVLRYISADTAREIADRDLTALQATVRRATGVEVELADDARQLLHDAVSAPGVLYNGGRGVGTLIEELVADPLAADLIGEPSTTSVLVTTDTADPGRLRFVLTSSLRKA